MDRLQVQLIVRINRHETHVLAIHAVEIPIRLSDCGLEVNVNLAANNVVKRRLFAEIDVAGRK